MAIIEFINVWEMYRIKFVTDGKVSWENFWALKDISFEVAQGETLGIIGENGAGKSTILKLIVGMLKPDRGQINVEGRVSGLLELGAGFQPELTGRENVYLNAGLFGLSRPQIEARYEEVVHFADIGRFIDAPVKFYSQGMFVRLAFAIAIHIDPDILLIDDTLAVGDEHFQRKCIKKIFEIKEQNKTILFVTHDMNMLRRLCKRALFLREGRIIKDGLVDTVVPLYTQIVGTREGVGILEKKSLSLIFNNGRLFLNWQDKLLTSNFGIHTVFLMNDKWYSSSQADWEVEIEDRNKLIAKGKFYQLALTQIWNLEIRDNYDIKCDIELDSEGPYEIPEAYTNIMLISDYTDWLTTTEKGEFPVIDDKIKNWQALLDTSIPVRCIVVKTDDSSTDSKIPSLVFKLKSLKKLYLNGNSIEQIPEELFELEKLEVLYLHHNKIKELPAAIKKMH
ncbi:MAG: ABC transporter ATP-binding protein [Candidatus Omnitrophica bacterium]|nr:ABC transporter ATP-binding protein [Candidatus Omnitrophota bacterium]